MFSATCEKLILAKNVTKSLGNFLINGLKLVRSPIHANHVTRSLGIVKYFSMNKLNLVRNLIIAQNVTRSLGNVFSWTNILIRNFILAKNVTRSLGIGESFSKNKLTGEEPHPCKEYCNSSNIVSWANSHWWETSSMQSMWQKVWVLGYFFQWTN